MAYPSLIIYYSNLNNLEIIIKKLGIHINLLHKILNFLLNFKKLSYLLEQKKVVLKCLKINFCVHITVLLWKCPCHRSLILKSIQKI